jgi:hypothetical protein
VNASLVSIPQPSSLRAYAAAAPTAAAKGEHGALDTFASVLGTGATGLVIGTAASMAAFEASLPVATAVLSRYDVLGGLFGTLQYAIMSQMGQYGAVGAAALLGAAVGMRAMCDGQTKTIGLIDRPAAAIREGMAQIDAAQTCGEAAKAGAKAGWKAGQTFGALAGGIQGAASGYSIGMMAAGLVSSGAAAGMAGAIGGALVAGAALCLAGKYVGGAVGAGLGAAAGAVGQATR